MTWRFALIALLCFIVLPAEAREAHSHAQGLVFCPKDQTYRQTCGGGEKPVLSHRGASANGRVKPGHDPRPRAWCGWQLRQWLNVADRAGNRAIWWARYGTNAHGPVVGAIVVWRHHVGLITARTETGWVVRSGNDGHAVRERERSLRGAIAFRLPNQIASR